MYYKQFFLACGALIVVLLVVFTFTSSTLRPLSVVAGDVTPTQANYLPVVFKPEATPTMTFTPTMSPTPTMTPTPTATATSSPAPADVRLTLIMYDPPGNDLDGEYVAIRNFGGTTAVMTGWTLRDDDGRIYNFPAAFSLAPGATVQVWTKSGTNTAANLYWGSAQSIWTNTGDIAYLYNGGSLIDSCSYAGGGSQVNC